MTTSLQVSAADDLFVPNPVMNFPEGSGKSHQPLAGLAWFDSRTEQEQTVRSILGLVHAFVSSAPHYRAWLAIGNQAWQPDNRVSRFQTPKKLLAELGFSDLSQVDFFVQVHAKDKQLRCFVATDFSNVSASSASMPFLRSSTCCVIVSEAGSSPEPFLSTGWSGRVWDCLDLLDVVSARRGLLLRKLGDFDDRERGVVGIGCLNAVRDLCCFSKTTNFRSEVGV